MIKVKAMRYLKKLTIILAVTVTMLFMGGCGLAQLINLINCKFSLANISDITWAEIGRAHV